MTSESPGDSDVVENNFLRNKNILKKENPLNSRDGSQCLYLGNKLAMASSRLLLIALLVSSLVSRGKAEGFCEPVLLCSCQLSSANCSWRGLLTLPAGLHNNLKYLGEVFTNLRLYFANRSCLQISPTTTCRRSTTQTSPSTPTWRSSTSAGIKSSAFKVLLNGDNSIAI